MTDNAIRVAPTVGGDLRSLARHVTSLSFVPTSPLQLLATVTIG